MPTPALPAITMEDPADYEIEGDDLPAAAVATTAPNNSANTNNKRRIVSTTAATNSVPKRAKKPRDHTLRNCFTIVPLPAGEGESITCNYCTHYAKTLRIFNPTKARYHLTQHCLGIDEGLRSVLLNSSQASKKRNKELGFAEGSCVVGGGALPAVKAEERVVRAANSTGNNAAMNMTRHPAMMARTKPRRDRPSSHTLVLCNSNTEGNIFDQDETIIVTAPIEKGEMVLNVVWTNAVEGVARHAMKFNVMENLEGAASTIVGYISKVSERENIALVSGQVVGDMTHEEHGLANWSVEEEGSVGEKLKVVEKILKSLLVA